VCGDSFGQSRGRQQMATLIQRIKQYRLLGLVVDHARRPIDLGGFPSRVRQMVAAQNEAGGVLAR
jgi:hypothetical protein